MKRALLIVGAIIALSAASVALWAQASVVTSADVQVQLGDLFFADGRYADAQEAYRRALGTDDEALSVRAGSGLVLALLRTGDFQEAFDVSSSVGSRHATNPALSAVRGDALWSIGRFEEAEARYEAALAIDPGRRGPATAARDRSRRATGWPTRSPTPKTRSSRIRARRSSITRSRRSTSACVTSTRRRERSRATSTSCPTRTAARRPPGPAPRSDSSSPSRARAVRDRRAAAERCLDDADPDSW